MEKNKNKKQSKQNNEQIRPLFEDFGNEHFHDEKSYNDLKNKN